MYYKLIRNNSSYLGEQPRTITSSPASSDSSKAVPGKLYRVSHYFNKRTGLLVERLHFICETLENADYLIPALIYRITVTQSPKFKRLLPFINQVPGRTGIRVHRGALPEHSRGCILVSAENEKQITELWLTEQHEKQETRLEICAQ